jgi:hypothetical protein
MIRDVSRYFVDLDYVIEKVEISVNVVVPAGSPFGKGQYTVSCA